MKKVTKVILCTLGTFIAFIVILLFSFIYVTDYKKTVCDESISPDGKYKLTLMLIGEPVLFSSADGRLVLKNGSKKISQTDFVLGNDGGKISSGCWKVMWHENYVEVILSGKEQADEQVILYFDGTSDI